MQNCFISVLFAFESFVSIRFTKFKTKVKQNSTSTITKFGKKINQNNCKTKVRDYGTPVYLKITVIFVTSKNNDYTAQVCM